MPDFLDIQEAPALSGAGLLGLVTTGMYNDPLSMYREYIQNAADAVGGRGFPARARVEIIVDATGRRVRIRDYGPGLSREEALERLLPIGRSSKRLGADRGFRGVGRLAGLTFARKVSFITRACEDQPVTKVTWHSDRLPELTSTESELDRAVLSCVDVETLPGSDYPEHFFDVEVGDVARHSAGLVLNRDAVRDYVGEVCPVPMNSRFPFADRVEGLFECAEAEGPLTLDVMLEGDSAPVERPYGELIRLSASTEVAFTEFQEVRIPTVDDSGDAAVGWVAHSPYLGAIPKEQRVRGIRVRVGNIQIGDERVFDRLFAEERFNRWCVGELHILDPRIIPNARRDYFEPGPHLRNLENQLTPVLRNISTRCRQESAARNRSRRALSALCTIEDLYGLATSGLLNAEDSAGRVQEALREVGDLRKRIGKGSLDDDTLERLNTAEEKLNNFSTETELQPFGSIPFSEVVVYQRVFGALANLVPSGGSAREMIETVFAEASRVGQNGSDPEPEQEDRELNAATLDDTRAPTSRQ
ncbi:MAG: ATP-binding protein [Chloroflexota bacterium]|nr:ATP-binding protein [Chloroflexota bacterium]